jgi:enamine deaminase RidA (YjgF/YER057c/UK114 family)
VIERYASGGPYEARYGYSRAVRVGDWVATAGCTAVVDGAVRHVGDPYRQAVTALRAGIDALAAAGARPSDVAQTRMYITDRAHADAVGRAHRDVLGAQCPAATMVVVGLIDEQMLVEVELVAMVGSAAT